MGVVDKRQAVCLPDLIHSVRSASYPPDSKKGGLTMVTISDLIQIGILIVGIIGLVLQILEIDRNRRQ